MTSSSPTEMTTQTQPTSRDALNEALQRLTPEGADLADVFAVQRDSDLLAAAGVCWMLAKAAAAEGRDAIWLWRAGSAILDCWRALEEGKP